MGIKMQELTDIQLNAVTGETLSAQLIAIMEKMEFVTGDQRLMLNKASGILHEVLLGLAGSGVKAEESASPSPQFIAKRGVEILRGLIGREPDQDDLELAARVGLPAFQVSQPVFVHEQGGSVRGTVTAVVNDGEWVYKVSGRGELFPGSYLAAVPSK